VSDRCIHFRSQHWWYGSPYPALARLLTQDSLVSFCYQPRTSSAFFPVCGHHPLTYTHTRACTLLSLDVPEMWDGGCSSITSTSTEVVGQGCQPQGSWQMGSFLQDLSCLQFLAACRNPLINERRNKLSSKGASGWRSGDRKAWPRVCGGEEPLGTEE
jgi:hypothetical protein